MLPWIPLTSSPSGLLTNGIWQRWSDVTPLIRSQDCDFLLASRISFLLSLMEEGTMLERPPWLGIEGSVWPTGSQELRCAVQQPVRSWSPGSKDMSSEADAFPFKPWGDHSQADTLRPWGQGLSHAAPGFLTYRNCEVRNVCGIKLLSFGVICYAVIDNMGMY